MRELFRFPNPVDERAARLVAAGVVVMTVAIVVGRVWWMLPVLAYGFVARVAAGPRFTPLGLVVTRVIVPRLDGEPKLVPGPPKRFAQAIGATLSVGALVAHLFNWDDGALVLVAMITAAATLESVFAYCLGCQIFSVLMRAGVIPESVCEECADISSRLRVTA
jgi:hypothetical protein